MLSARIVERPARFDRVDRVKAAVGQPVLPGDDRFWILGDPLVVQVDGGERIEVPVGFTTDGASVPGWAQTLTGWEPWAGPAALGGGGPRLALFAARCLQVTRRRSLSGRARVRRGQLVEAEADVCRRRRRRLVGLPSGPGQRPENLPLTRGEVRELEGDAVRVPNARLDVPASGWNARRLSSSERVITSRSERPTSSTSKIELEREDSFRFGPS